MLSTKYDSEKKIWSGPDMHSPMFHDNVTVGRGILYLLSLSPEKVCQISIDDGSQRTNKQIHDQTLKIAYNLQELEIGKGDVIGFVCANSHELTPAILAGLFLGAPVNVSDVSFNKEEITHMFSVIKPKLVFCDDHVVETVQEALKELKNHARIFVLGEKVPNLGHIKDLLDDAGKQSGFQNLMMQPPKVDRDSCAVILCSSDTTGLPKGVAVSHEIIQLTCFQPFMRQKCESGDLVFSFSSLYEQSGYASLIGALYIGLTRLITTASFSPEKFVKVMQQYKPSIVISAAPDIKQLIYGKHLKGDIITHVKWFMSLRDFLPMDVSQKLKSLMPNGVFKFTYGPSETGVISRNISPESDETAGKLAPGVFANVMDKEGKQLGVGEIGELCVKTKTEFLGYYNNQEATKEIRDTVGWIRTGDYGYFNNDGFLTITGRKKDLL